MYQEKCPKQHGPRRAGGQCNHQSCTHQLPTNNVAKDVPARRRTTTRIPYASPGHNPSVIVNCARLRLLWVRTRSSEKTGCCVMPWNRGIRVSRQISPPICRQSRCCAPFLLSQSPRTPLTKFWLCILRHGLSLHLVSIRFRLCR